MLNLKKFSIKNGKLISEVDNDAIFKVVDHGIMVFQLQLTIRQFEVAHYNICLTEAETKAKSLYPKKPII